MAKGARLETGISDDGESFTVLAESDELDDVTGDAVKDDEPGDTEEEEFFDFDKIPEDQREGLKGTFEKMQTAFKEKTKGNADLEERAGMVDTLVEKLNTLSTAVSSATQEKKPDETPVDKTKERALKFEFEQKDYYQPAFEELAGLISDLKTEITGVRTGIDTDKQTTFADRVNNFFDEAKLDKTVVKQMDNIAGKMGRGVYNDLPRLAKLAKMELGLPTETKTKIDNVTKLPQKRVGVKSQVESGSRRARDVEKKDAQTITEAWDQSEAQLRKQGE